MGNPKPRVSSPTGPLSSLSSSEALSCLYSVWTLFRFGVAECKISLTVTESHKTSSPAVGPRLFVDGVYGSYGHGGGTVGTPET